MADQGRHLATLNYGHLGTATYSRKDQEWNFARTIGKRDRTTRASDQPDFLFFRELSEKESVHPEKDRVLSTKDDDPKTAISELDLRDILKTNPELVPASSLLLEYGRKSHKDERTAPAELLAFGSALVAESRRVMKHIPIAAYAAGTSGECLRLATLGTEHTNTLDENGEQIVVELPCISQDSTCDWTGHALPLQQIVFSSAPDTRPSWLAVRQDSGITVFRPRFHRHNLKAPSSPRGEGSQLDANPVFILPLSRTGGHSPANMAFMTSDYPVFSRLAIVDSHGHWSMWHITEHRKAKYGSKPKIEVSLVQHGQLHMWNERYQPDSPMPHHDGWHAVRWIQVADQEWKLAIFDRHKAIIVNPATGQQIDVPMIDLGPTRWGHWILDVKSTNNAGDLMLLTSTQIILLSSSSDAAFSVTPIWRHFLAISDATLNMVLLETFGETTVLVYSASNNLVTAFRLLRDEDSHRYTALSDPTAFQLSTLSPLLGNQISNGTGVSQLQIHDLEYRVKGNGPPSIRLFKMFVVTEHSSVHEILLKGIKTTALSEFRSGYGRHSLPLPPSGQPKSAAYIDDNELDDFIVDDDEAHDTFAKSEWQQDHISAFAMRRRLEEAVASHFIDWSEVYKAVVGIGDVGASATAQTQQDVKFWDDLKHIHDSLGNDSEDGRTLCLLSDLKMQPEHHSILDDVDANQDNFRALLGQISRMENVTLRQLWQDDSHEEVQASKLYRDMMSLFHTPLPSSVPARIRIAKEKVIRQVAAQFALSSLSVHRDTQPSSEEAVPDEAINPSSPYLPFTQSSRIPPSSPTPSPTPPQHPTSSSLLSSAYTRLSTYTTISPSPNTPSSVPETISRLLSHLPPSESPLPDPTTYSYTTSRLHEDPSSTTTKKSAAQERAEARLQRKRQRQQEKFESNQRERFAPPMVMSSQPAGGVRDSRRDRTLPILTTTTQSQRQGRQPTSRRVPGFGAAVIPLSSQPIRTSPTPTAGGVRSQSHRRSIYNDTERLRQQLDSQARGGGDVGSPPVVERQSQPAGRVGLGSQGRPGGGGVGGSQTPARGPRRRAGF